MNDVRAGAANVRAVFFDAGFTLIHPRSPVVDLYVEAARAVAAVSCDATLRGVFQRTWAAGTRDARDDHRSSDVLERARWRHFTRKIAEEVPELLPHHEAWLARLTTTFDAGDGWRLAPGAAALLRDLRARNVTVGIVSNWHGGLHRVLQHLGLDAEVDFVVCSADVGYRKPHPAIFEEALRRSGATPASVIHVGDTWDEDVVGALAVGITPVHVAEAAARRPGAGHHSVSSLDEVARFV